VALRPDEVSEAQPVRVRKPSTDTRRLSVEARCVSSPRRRSSLGTRVRRGCGASTRPPAKSPSPTGSEILPPPTAPTRGSGTQNVTLGRGSSHGCDRVRHSSHELLPPQRIRTSGTVGRWHAVCSTSTDGAQEARSGHRQEHWGGLDTVSRPA
jgi:hypothetical protein